MKKQFFLSTLFVCLTATIFAQNANLITTESMGPFKIGSPLSEIENITKSKIKLKKNIKDAWLDTVAIVYNKVNYTMEFSANEDAKGQKYWALYSVASSTTPFKTESGIGIGSTKAQLLEAFDKSSLSIYNDDRGKGKPDKIQNIELYGDAKRILFITVDRKVTKIKVAYTED